MKTKHVLFTGAAIALLLLPACSGDEPEYRTETSMLDSDALLKEMSVGETRQFYTQEGGTAGLTWFSADTAVARVSADGKVTAVAAGETTISAGIDNRTMADYSLIVYPGYVRITGADGTSVVQYLAESDYQYTNTTDDDSGDITVHRFEFASLDDRSYDYDFVFTFRVYTEGHDNLNPEQGDWILFPAEMNSCCYNDYRYKGNIYLTRYTFSREEDGNGNYSISVDATDEENRSVEMRYKGPLY